MEKNYLIVEALDMTKSELKSLIRQIFKDEMDSEFKKKQKDKEILSKNDIKDIVKDMMIKQYKFFWEKKSFWVNNI